MEKKQLKCKNCSLYNKKEGVCSVVIMHDGQKWEMKTKPNDNCAWIEHGIDIQGVRAWSDGENGYIEYTTDYEPKEEII